MREAAEQVNHYGINYLIYVSSNGEIVEMLTRIVLYEFKMLVKQAGIPVKQLAIALEPEAASVLCRTVEVYVSSNDGMEGVKKSPCSIPDNSTYLVIDIGGILILGAIDVM